MLVRAVLCPTPDQRPTMPSSAHKPSTTTTTTLPPPNPATPTRARSTSLGPGIARRGPQKAHIPFRADDLERGKKTGIEVAYLDHKSDEFEPFSEIIGLADGRSPRGKKGKARKSTGVVGEGEDGEMSMELDHSTSPLPPFSLLLILTTIRHTCISLLLLHPCRLTIHINWTRPRPPINQPSSPLIL